MFLERKPLGVYGANCYIAGCEETGRAVAIDPGGEPEEVEKILEENGLALSCIVLTHGHGDHIAGVPALKEKYGVDVYVHSADAELLRDSEKNLSDMMPIEPVTIGGFIEIEDGETIGLGSLKLELLHTPGHTRGCICIKISDKLFTGDTLFKGSIGRTDLYGGGDDLVESVKKKLLTLDPETVVLPGHGAVTTLRDEIATNPFIRNLETF